MRSLDRNELTQERPSYRHIEINQMIYRAYQLAAFYVIEIVVEGLWPLKINKHFIDKVLVKGHIEYISLIFYSIIFIFEDS